MHKSMLSALLIFGCTNAPPQSPAGLMAMSAKGGHPLSHTSTVQRCGPEAISDPFDRVYEAIPTRLKREFAKDKENFVIGLQSLSICRLQARTSNPSIFMPTLSDAFESCWRLGRDDSGKPIPQILVQQDAGALHRNLIPMTVAAFSEFYIDELFGPSLDQTLLRGKSLAPDEVVLARFVQDFRRGRQLLSQALVDDFRAAGNNQILETWSERFQTSPHALGDSKAFQNFVLAGLAGAYYCNPESAEQFNANELIRVRSAFIGMAEFLGQPWYANAPATGQRL